MSLFEAIVLGIVQGLTEFLPISSSGHLRIVPAFFGWEDPGAAFTAVIQLGTMAAVLLYFRRDLWNLTRGFLRGVPSRSARSTPEFKLASYIILGTVPIALVGLAFKDQIETGARNLMLIGTTLILFSFVMEIAERIGKKNRSTDSLNLRDGMFIGVFQAFALIPGVSRSGSTISAGLFRGFERAAAARYSFLLSVPAVVLSGLFEIRHIGGEGGVGLLPTVVATVSAFIFGWLSIAGLLRYLVRHTVTVFVIYRIVLGIAVLSLASTGVIN